MRVLLNKGIEQLSLYPDTDWVGDALYVVPDGTELANKLLQYAPYYDFVLDENGQLIDITPTERPNPPQDEPTDLQKTQAQVEKNLASSMLNAALLEDAINDLDNRLTALNA